MKRIVYHVDVNSAFLSWEAVYRLHHLGGRLDLRQVPSAVGGDREKRHGIILAKSIPAGRFGVETGEPVGAAREKCPELLVVPPNYDLYNRASRALLKILARYTDRIEQYSIDEAFLEMTGCTREPRATAEELRETVCRELGFTVNVGVAGNKLLAKMASDLKKPNLVHTLWPEEIPAKMWPLPVRELFYVGAASEKKLALLGIRTIGELARTPEEVLSAHMKFHGRLIRQYALGMDDSPVEAHPPANKGYGNSLTTPQDVTELWLARRYLLSLAETVSARLRADEVRVRVVSVSIRDWQLCFWQHQITLDVSTDLTWEIYQAACTCFDQLWDGRPVRHLGIHTGQVTRERGRQLGLFDSVDYEKQKRAEAAVDSLRRRYGQDIIMRASFLPSPADGGIPYIDHMGGGISREKRRPDYSREVVI